MTSATLYGLSGGRAEKTSAELGHRNHQLLKPGEAVVTRHRP